MNKVILSGCVTKDIEVKNTASGNAVCSFTIAVKRKFKDANGEYQTDFINCVAWRGTANFISSYFHKGSKIAIIGNIQVRTYEGDDGKKRYVTEVIVDEAEFVDSKPIAKDAPTSPDVSDDLPFAVDDDVADTLEF